MSRKSATRKLVSDIAALFQKYNEDHPGSEASCRFENEVTVVPPRPGDKFQRHEPTGRISISIELDERD